MSVQNVGKSHLIGIAGVLSLIWLAPFCISYHVQPIGFFWQEWLAVLLLCVLTIWRLLISGEKLTLYIPKITLSPALLGLVIVLQFLLHKYIYTDQLSIPLIYLSLAVLACCWGQLFAKSDSVNEVGLWIAVACVLGGVFNVGVQFAQLFRVEDNYSIMSIRLTGEPLFGNIHQTNHLAAYLAMGLAAALYCRMRSQIGSIVHWMVSSVLVCGLVLTGQRSSLVELCMLLLSTLLAWRTLPGRRRMLLQSSSFLLVLFAALYFLLMPLMVDGEAHLYQPLNTLETDLRWDLWRQAWMMFNAHPWLGVGFSQFWAAGLEQLDVLPGNTIFSHPHNLLVALFAETGCIGALLTLIPIMAWGLRTRLTPHSDIEWLGWTQLWIIGVHSMIEFPLWYTYWLIIACFWLGFLDKSSLRVTFRNPRLIAAFLVLMMAIPLMNSGFAFQKLVSLAYMPTPNGEDEITFKEYRAGSIVNLSNHWLLQREASYRIAVSLMDASPDHIDDKISFNEKVIKTIPAPMVVSNQVILLVLKGNIDDAVHLLARSRKFFPAQYPGIIYRVLSSAKKNPMQFTPDITQRLKSVSSN